VTEEAIDPDSLEFKFVFTLDNLGKRYGLLPSEVISRASTFDLVIMDMAIGYEHHVQEKQKPGYVPNVSVEDLIKIKESV
jgi:hypothetical protein